MSNKLTSPLEVDTSVSNDPQKTSDMDNQQVGPQTPASDGLIDSWCELTSSALKGSTGGKRSGASTPSMEKLLHDAQKEPGMASRNSSSGRNSVKALSSPPLSIDVVSSDDSQDETIIREWPSRLEKKPTSQYYRKNPPSHDSKQYRFSLRKSKIMDKGLDKTLLFTHAASFAVGASLMVLWYKSQH